MKTQGSPFFYQIQTIPAHFEHLKAIGEFVERACQAAAFDARITYAVKLAVDEACSNIIEHACRSKPETCDIACTCAVDEYALYIELHDHGTPFDPSQIPEPDIGAGLDGRGLGGLGIYFMRHLMDEVSFHFVSQDPQLPAELAGNILLMVKYRDRVP
ncbi:MAG: ATP-binding protein [Anaerolineales bacterium]|nr:ATP-binding protein [Anaerolineales bacterium]